MIRQSVASVNFHDIYVRSGAYKTLPLPGIPGLEAVGTVEALGEVVTLFSVGDQVGYISRNYGAYARYRVLDATLAAPLPQGVDDALAAAWFLKGLTAQVLVEEIESVGPGMLILVQAAGGGVGQLVARMAKLRGATVIGTAGSPEKMAIARAAGCDHVIAYRDEEVAERVKEITGGAGVAVSYDAVGADTFEGSLSAPQSKAILFTTGRLQGQIHHSIYRGSELGLLRSHAPFWDLLLTPEQSLWPPLRVYLPLLLQMNCQ